MRPWAALLRLLRPAGRRTLPGWWTPPPPPPRPEDTPPAWPRVHRNYRPH